MSSYINLFTSAWIVNQYRRPVRRKKIRKFYISKRTRSNSIFFHPPMFLPRPLGALSLLRYTISPYLDRSFPSIMHRCSSTNVELWNTFSRENARLPDRVIAAFHRVPLSEGRISSKSPAALPRHSPHVGHKRAETRQKLRVRAGLIRGCEQ